MCSCSGATDSGKKKTDTPCDAGSGATCPTPPIGTLILTKLKFITIYDICSDDVDKFSDYKNFYILEDSGKYEFHWLKERKNAEDKAKPSNLPITFHSSQALEFTASFKVDGPPLPGNPIIKIDESTGAGFTFDSQNGQASGEYQLNFSSKNLPYKDTINHIGNFDLNFQYSNDGGATWLDAGQSSNELYITWKAFDLSSLFQDGFPKNNEQRTMKVISNRTGSKKYILESLLHIGCTQAKNKGKSEEEILDAIFSLFEGLQVNPKRKTFPKGMGYWRGTSSATPSSNFGDLRSLRYLLKQGEARCGEWTTFLNHIAYTQGIVAMGNVPIATKSYTKYTTYFPASTTLLDTGLLSSGFSSLLLLVKNCSIKPRIDPATGNPTSVLENFDLSRAQGNDDAVNIFWDHVFSRHETSGRFFDASYGGGKSVFPDKASSSMKNYCDKMLDGLLFKKTGGSYDLFIRHFGGLIESGIDYKTVKTNSFAYLGVTRSDVA